MPRITIEVDEDGNLHADFSGFRDRACEGEEERFRALMAGFGLLARVDRVRRKSDGEILIESGQAIGGRARWAVRG
jgi:hypothetical protein